MEGSPGEASEAISPIVGFVAENPILIESPAFKGITVWQIKTSVDCFR